MIMNASDPSNQSTDTAAEEGHSKSAKRRISRGQGLISVCDLELFMMHTVVAACRSFCHCSLFAFMIMNASDKSTDTAAEGGHSKSAKRMISRGHRLISVCDSELIMMHTVVWRLAGLSVIAHCLLS